MSITTQICKPWVCLGISCFICVLLYSFIYFPALHGRLNLLASGYVLCQVSDAPKPYPESPASKVVSSHGVQVGYLNSSAEFISITDSSPSNGFQRDVRVNFVLFHGLLVFGACGATIAAYLLWRSIQRIWE